MAKWAARILPVIEACYLGQLMHPSAVIKVGVTLHANKGPDTAIKTLPATLAAMVPCATTKLMNARPPMLTGTEGETHTVGIRFTP